MWRSRIDALRRGWNHPLLISAQHDSLEAKLAHGVIQLGNAFFRRLGWNDGNGRKSLEIRLEHVPRHHVVGARHGDL